MSNVTTTSEAIAQRFRDAGFPESDIHILGPNDRKKNLVGCMAQANTSPYS